MLLTKYFRLAAAAAALIAASRVAEAADPVAKGGTLIYLEQQTHTNLYPPAGGFYPNGGVLNQITDKLTYQNPKTLEIEPWIAESWTVNADATEYVCSEVARPLIAQIREHLAAVSIDEPSRADVAAPTHALTFDEP